MGNMVQLVQIIELVAVGVIFFFGIICNCIVIRSICLSRSMRTSILYNIKNDCTNLLVMNLAITDLLVLLVSVPMDIVPEHLSWPYGVFVCKAFSPIQDICLTASTLTFSAIAVERYLVSKGTAHQGLRNAKLVRKINLDLIVLDSTIRTTRVAIDVMVWQCDADVGKKCQRKEMVIFFRSCLLRHSRPNLMENTF